MSRHQYKYFSFALSLEEEGFVPYFSLFTSQNYFYFANRATGHKRVKTMNENIMNFLCLLKLLISVISDRYDQLDAALIRTTVLVPGTAASLC